MIDKENQYDSFYVPEHMIEEKFNVNSVLLDIDCNFSRFIQVIMRSLWHAACYIKKLELSYRHFDWAITIKNKNDGRVTTFNKHWKG